MIIVPFLLKIKNWRIFSSTTIPHAHAHHQITRNFADYRDIFFKIDCFVKIGLVLKYSYSSLSSSLSSLSSLSIHTSSLEW
jgi:hypothetical protein